jgi:hypothetical protein
MYFFRAKQAIKRALPDFLLNPLLKGRSWLRYRSLRFTSPDKVFTTINSQNLWGSEESVSGKGSELNYTRSLRERLPGILAEVGVRSILDAPCGDFHWMQHVDLGGRKYFGVDIVQKVIEQNQAQYGNELREFAHRNIISDPLPQADFVICRDCFIHLSNRDILSALRNLKRTGARFLLTTTFPDQKRNTDIITGAYRPMNLQLKPFYLPKPRLLVYEAFEGGVEKHMGLWAMEDVPFE